MYGFGSFALDYRGERLRFSVDAGYNNTELGQAGLFRSVLPGVVIPRAPNLRINQHQAFEYFGQDNCFLASRAEYDLTDSVTL